MTKVASWALAVRVSSSIGASSRRVVRSRPAISDASVATSHDGCSTQAWPIPDRCDPCPGKVKASTYRLLSNLFGRLRPRWLDKCGTAMAERGDYLRVSWAGAAAVDSVPVRTTDPTRRDRWHRRDLTLGNHHRSRCRRGSAPTTTATPMGGALMGLCLSPVGPGNAEQA